MNYYEVYEAIDSRFLDLYSRIESPDLAQVEEARKELSNLSFRQFIDWHGPLATVMLIKHIKFEEIFDNLRRYRSETDCYKDFERMADSWPSDFVRKNIGKFARLYPEEFGVVLKAAKKSIEVPNDIEFLFNTGISYAYFYNTFKESSLWKESCDYPEVLFKCFEIFEKHGLCKWRIKTDFLYDIRPQWKIDQMVNPDRWTPYLVSEPGYATARDS